MTYYHDQPGLPKTSSTARISSSTPTSPPPSLPTSNSTPDRGHSMHLRSRDPRRPKTKWKIPSLKKPKQKKKITTSHPPLPPPPPPPPHPPHLPPKHDLSSPEPKVVILYHGQHCTDGWGSALAAFLKFGINAIYLPMSHADNDQPPDVRGKDVYILDFCFKKEVIEKMIEDADSVLVIDHHKTAEKELCNISDKNKIFDMNKSGAVLTWEYFFPDKKVPLLFQHIQDRDIWTKKLKGTDAVAVVLQDMNKTIENVEDWQYYLDDDTIPKLIDKGSSVLEHQKQNLKKLRRSSYIDEWTLCLEDGKLRKHKVVVVNSPLLQSDLGGMLLLLDEFREARFAAIYYYNGVNTVFSLRSCDDKQDVSVVAKLFGGGGHRNASGCALKGFSKKLEHSHIDCLRMKLHRCRQRCSLRWSTLRPRLPPWCLSQTL